MKRYTVSVFLVTVASCGAFSTEMNSIGNKSEEQKLLTDLKQVVIDYHNGEDEDCYDITEQIEYLFIFYKKKYNVNAETEKLFEFLGDCAYDVHLHYDYLDENGNKEEAAQMLENWSINQSLENWKKNKDEAVQTLKYFSRLVDFCKQ